MVWTCWVAMEATTERPKRNGVMRRLRLANPRCLPRSLRTSASRTAWNLLAMMVDCWRSIRLSFHESKGFGGLDGSCQKSREFQEVRSSRPVVDSLSPYLCAIIRPSTESVTTREFLCLDTDLSEGFSPPSLLSLQPNHKMR